MNFFLLCCIDALDSLAPISENRDNEEIGAIMNDKPDNSARPRKERILDAAEELIAHHGYDGVTLRQIANKADVDGALPSYHFGKKHDLFEAVFVRRAEVLNDLRLSALEACEEAAGPDGPTVEAIIEAFLRPMELPHEEDDEGWRNYLALVAYVNNSPVWARELMTRHFNPLIKRYIEALKRALPGAPEENIYWAYHYLSGSLTLTMARTGRLDILSHGLCSSEDFKTAYGRMIPFIAAGFRQICEPGK